MTTIPRGDPVYIELSVVEVIVPCNQGKTVRRFDFPGNVRIYIFYAMQQAAQQLFPVLVCRWLGILAGYIDDLFQDRSFIPAVSI